MTTQETPSAGLPVLQVPINFVPAKAGEALKFGQMTIRKMEDDFHTDKTFSKNSTNISTYQLSQDNRIGTAEFIIPTNTNGPRRIGTRCTTKPSSQQKALSASTQQATKTLKTQMQGLEIMSQCPKVIGNSAKTMLLQ